MKHLMPYILARAAERSTWLGLVSLATGLGLALTPEEAQAIAAAGMAIAGLIAVFTKDRGSKK